jgi:hypothetical protein
MKSAFQLFIKELNITLVTSEPFILITVANVTVWVTVYQRRGSSIT